MRAYEVMVILDPSLDERTVAPSLDTYLNLVRKDGGQVDNVEVWGRRRLAYEIQKHTEGIYAVVDLQAEPATVKELDRLIDPRVHRPGTSRSERSVDGVRFTGTTGSRAVT
jgi:small subunit ribosomal protein S6